MLPAHARAAPTREGWRHDGPRSRPANRPPRGGADPATLCDIFQGTVQAVGDGPALRREDGAIAHTWRSYGDAVRATALGLARLGLRRGDTLALMMGNRPEFNVLDTAALHLGAPTVSIYQTLAPATIAHVLADSQARAIVCEPRYLPALEAAGTPLEHVIVLDAAPGPGQLSLDHLMSAPADDTTFEQLWQAVQPADIATIIYTSGTTGPPKGVELTHGNVLATLRATDGLVPIGPGDRTISALPMAHIAERWGTHYQGMRFGLDVTCVDDLTRMAEVLPQVRPQLWGSVPRIWEKLHQSLRAKLDEQPDEVRQLLDGAINAGIAAVRAQQAPTPRRSRLTIRASQPGTRPTATSSATCGLGSGSTSSAPASWAPRPARCRSSSSSTPYASRSARCGA